MPPNPFRLLQSPPHHAYLTTFTGYFGCVIGGASLFIGNALQSSSTGLALAGCAIGACVYVLIVRLTRTGLTIEDRDALVGATAKPIQPYLSRLLGPVTTPGVA